MRRSHGVSTSGIRCWWTGQVVGRVRCGLSDTARDHVPHGQNDSHLFQDGGRSLRRRGFLPGRAGNRWQKGEELYLPLYQGRMIHQFDHRANSVRVNSEQRVTIRT